MRASAYNRSRRKAPAPAPTRHCLGRCIRSLRLASMSIRLLSVYDGDGGTGRVRRLLRQREEDRKGRSLTHSQAADSIYRASRGIFPSYGPAHIRDFHHFYYRFWAKPTFIYMRFLSFLFFIFCILILLIFLKFREIFSIAIFLNSRSFFEIQDFTYFTNIF